MTVADTLAYYAAATITAVKSFIVQAPGQNVCKVEGSNETGYLTEGQAQT